MHRDPFLNFRKRKREAVLRKMAAMRAAKERKRLARWPRDEEPPMRRTTGLSFGLRDEISGVVAWREFRSAREVARIVAVVLKHYQPGHP